MEENLFKNIIGHDKQKLELKKVIEWFVHSEELEEKGLEIPRGIILNGAPGNGKTLFIKEIIANVDIPTFVFNDTTDNCSQNFEELYKQASKEDKAIIIIDELDLLLAKNTRFRRVLQEYLDGLQSCKNILIITAVNDLDAIPDPILRNGRLEKNILIPYLDEDSSMELFYHYSNKYGLKFKDDLDNESLKTSLNGISCAGIKAVVNDIALRNGFDDIDEDMVYESIYNINDEDKDVPYKNYKYVAYHEAGHAIMARKYKSLVEIKSLRTNVRGGLSSVAIKEDEILDYDKMLANIEISLGGIIATKLIFGKGDYGCVSDLQKARGLAYSLVNVCGYKNTWRTLPLGGHTRPETDDKRRKNEKIIEKILRKAERNVYKYLTKHIEDIKKLGELLYEKRHLDIKQINNCFSEMEA